MTRAVWYTEDIRNAPQTYPRIRIAWLAAAVLASPLAAQESKTLDLSTAAGNKNYYVVFAARGGSATGHAFVVWGIEDGVRRRSSIKAFGLYPESDSANCTSMVRSVPGAVMDELVNHSVQGITVELIVRVDEGDYNRAWKVARAWDCRHEFSLLGKDCVEFLRAVGEAMDLPMPRRFVTRWTPQAYVRALVASVVDDGSADLGEAHYQGSLIGGKPMGHGVLTYRDGSFIDGTFWGLARNVGTGRLNGLDGGYRYEGQIVDGKAHGKGTLARVRITEDGEPTAPVLAGRFAGGVLQKVTRAYGDGRRMDAADLGLIAAPR